jgi:hypothetical protein
MNGMVRKLMKALALLVVGGLVLGGTIAFAVGSGTPSALLSTSSASDSPTQNANPVVANDDGTADQGPGDVPVVGGNASTDDDGTADQGPGDANEIDDHGDDDGHEAEGNHDNSGPSGNSGPGSVDDDSGHGEDD